MIKKDKVLLNNIEKVKNILDKAELPDIDRYLFLGDTEYHLYRNGEIISFKKYA